MIALARELPDGGLLEFEQADIGEPTKAGTPRKRDHRAYYYTPAGGERERMCAVSTVLDAICPKDGLPPWAEARGIEGTIEAIRLGEIDPLLIHPAEAVERVRFLGLGADRAKLTAATRGLNVHACLEQYMRTGSAPSLGDHPPEHRGYLQALSAWLLYANPEPVAIEELVCSPEDGYAGRMDLLAHTGGFLTAYDAKTQTNSGIYNRAHWQVALYVRALLRCGGEIPDLMKIVVFADNGEFREMACAVELEQVSVALNYWHANRPVVSACEAANRAEKKARAAA